MAGNIGRISGPLLKDNLLRDGNDLAFDTDLLYLKVSPVIEPFIEDGEYGDPNYDSSLPSSLQGTGIGINVDVPVFDLDVNNDIFTTDNIVNSQANIANLIVQSNSYFTTSVGPINLVPSQTNPYIRHDRLITDSLEFNDNNITGLIPDQNIELRPNATGTIELIANTNITGDLYVSGNIDISGNLTKQGSLILGDDVIDNEGSQPENDVVDFNVELQQSLIPGLDNAYDLGRNQTDSSFGQWQNIFFTDTSEIDTITPVNARISDQIFINGVDNEIFALQSNDDVTILPATQTTRIEEIMFEPQRETYYLPGAQTDGSYNISTLGFSGGITSFDFFNNGKILIVAAGTEIIYRYDLATPYDFSTITTTGISLDVSGQVSNMFRCGVTLSEDGTMLFIIENTASIYKYTMTTPFDLTTATLDSTGTSPRTASYFSDLRFSPNGKFMYFYARSNTSSRGTWWKIGLTNNWDISSGLSIIDGFNTSRWSSDINSVLLTPDEKDLIVLDDSLNQIVKTIDWAGLEHTDEFHSISSVIGSCMALASDGKKIFTASGSTIYSFRTDFYPDIPLINGGIVSQVNAFAANSDDIWKIDPTGTILFRWQTSFETVRRYDLNAPYDFSSVVQSQSILVDKSSPYTIGLSFFTFSPDGTHFYYMLRDSSYNKILKNYNLTTPYDLTTSSLLSSTTIDASINNSFGNIYVNADGTRVIIHSSFGDVETFTLSTGHDLSSASSTTSNINYIGYSFYKFSTFVDTNNPREIYYQPSSGAPSDTIQIYRSSLQGDYDIRRSNISPDPSAIGNFAVNGESVNESRVDIIAVTDTNIYMYDRITRDFVTLTINSFAPNDYITNLNNNDPISFTGTDRGYYQFAGTNAFVLPAGDNSTRPSTTEIGDTRWNTEEGYLECFDGNVYVIATGAGEEVTEEIQEDFANVYSLILG